MPADPFLAQVLQRPDDAHLRLIYADWLDDRGDVRGEFIRIQQEMDALPVYSDRYAELKPRREELRRKIDKKWLGQLGHVPTYRPMFTQLPEGRAERWRLVEEFIGYWYRPLRRGDGCPEKELAAAERRLGFRLPAALREWYALAGKRMDVWEKQEDPEETSHLDLLQMDEEHDALVLVWENDGPERWGIRDRDLQQEDPPVYRLSRQERLTPSTTTFAIQVLLCEATRSNIHGHGTFPRKGAAFQEIKRHYQRCRLPERYWCAAPVRFYEGKDLLIQTHAEQWIYVAARTEAAYAHLPQVVRARLGQT